jgi:hypothetical protein
MPYCFVDHESKTCNLKDANVRLGLAATSIFHSECKRVSFVLRTDETLQENTYNIIECHERVCQNVA